MKEMKPGIGEENSLQEEIVLYQSDDGVVRLETRFKADTLWLSMSQIARLFGVNVPAISKHVKNIYASGELVSNATVSKMETVRAEGSRRVSRKVDFYNLDMVLSVGYRVNSVQATHFRIWATRVLKDHLIKGFSINHERLRETGFQEIEQTVQLLARTLSRRGLVSQEGQELLGLISSYAKAWRLLALYDKKSLLKPAGTLPAKPVIDPKEASTLIATLKADLLAKGQASDLFGREHPGQLDGILGAVGQTFDGTPLYATTEERAAHLLYFIIKDHPFMDGNKRIGSLLFLWYLHESGLIAGVAGEKRVDENMIVALALLIAESEPSDKELVVKLILNLL